jgi:excisionase family DNA binding protein
MSARAKSNDGSDDVGRISPEGNGNVLDAIGAAELLGAHVESVRRLARKGEIPSYKIGKDWRFSKTSLLRWVETHHARQRPPLVLVIDDEKSFRETTRLFLEGGDFRAVIAADGEEGLELVWHELPDLVLLDLIMPGMSGVEVLKELHGTHPDLPVVVVTAYPETALMAEALNYPPVTLLPKPLGKAALLKTVHRVLNGSTAKR